MRHAWEYDYEMFCEAVPVKDRTDLIQWDGLLEGKMLEEAAQMLENGKGAWKKPLPESKAPYSKMLGAISSMQHMGYDVEEAERLIPEAFDAIEKEELIRLQIINARVFKALAEAKKSPIIPTGITRSMRALNSMKRRWSCRPATITACRTESGSLIRFTADGWGRSSARRWGRPWRASNHRESGRYSVKLPTM